jgi:hypothetical protein
MKTTIDIPTEDLDQLLKFTGAATKKEAVVTAVQDFNRRQRLSKLAEMLGTFDDFMDADELSAMRDS